MSGSGLESRDGRDEDIGLDINNIHATWDSNAEIRSRLRDGSTFLHPRSESKTDNNTCCLNKPILLPIVEKMSKGDRKLPSVADLRAEMTAVYTTNKRVDNADDMQTIIADSWHIRKLLSHIKAKTRRGEVSAESFFMVELFSSKMIGNLCLFSLHLSGSLSHCRRSYKVFGCFWEPEDPEFQEFCVLLDPEMQAPSYNTRTPKQQLLAAKPGHCRPHQPEARRAPSGRSRRSCIGGFCRLLVALQHLTYKTLQNPKP